MANHPKVLWQIKKFRDVTPEAIRIRLVKSLILIDMWYFVTQITNLSQRERQFQKCNETRFICQILVTTAVYCATFTF